MGWSQTAKAAAVLAAARANAQGSFASVYGEVAQCGAVGGPNNFIDMGCYSSTTLSSTLSSAFTPRNYVPGNATAFQSSLIGYWGSLDANANFNSTVAPLTCGQVCRGYGYKVALLLDGVCSCAPMLPVGATALSSTSGSGTQCTTRCSADSQQYCGGTSGVNVVVDPSFASDSDMRGASSLSSGYKYLGCFKNPGLVAQTGSAASVSACESTCSGLGYAMAAVSYSAGGNTCSCANSFGAGSYQINTTADPTGFCNTDCGLGTTTCAPGSVTCCGQSTYAPVYVNPDLTGCYTPQIPGFGATDSNGNFSNYICAATPSGLTGGPQTLLSQNSSSTARVNTTLPIHPKQVGSFHIYGCSGSNANNVTLDSSYVAQAGQKSLEGCATACAGYSYFGMVNGGQSCGCSNAIAIEPTDPMANCNVKCSSTPNQKCGAKKGPVVYATTAIQGSLYSSIYTTLTLSPRPTYSCSQPGVRGSTSTTSMNTTTSSAATTSSGGSPAATSSGSSATMTTSGGAASTSSGGASSPGSSAGGQGGNNPPSSSATGGGGAGASTTPKPSSAAAGSPTSSTISSATTVTLAISTPTTFAAIFGTPVDDAILTFFSVNGSSTEVVIQNDGCFVLAAGAFPFTDNFSPSGNLDSATCAQTCFSNSYDRNADNAGTCYCGNTQASLTKTDNCPGPQSKRSAGAVDEKDTSAVVQIFEVLLASNVAVASNASPPMSSQAAAPTSSSPHRLSHYRVDRRSLAAGGSGNGNPSSSVGGASSSTTGGGSSAGDGGGNTTPTGSNTVITSTSTIGITVTYQPGGDSPGNTTTDTGASSPGNTSTGTGGSSLGNTPTGSGSGGLTPTSIQGSTPISSAIGTYIIPTSSKSSGLTSISIKGTTPIGSATDSSVVPTGSTIPANEAFVIGIVPAGGNSSTQSSGSTEAKLQSGSGFIGNTGANNPSDCSQATQFNIIDGQLVGGGEVVSTDPGVSYAPLVVSATPGSITTTWELRNGNIVWDNGNFTGGTAGFCQGADLRVYTTSEGPDGGPAGCTTVSLVALPTPACPGLDGGSSGLLPANQTLILPNGIYFPASAPPDEACTPVVESWTIGQFTVIPSPTGSARARARARQHL